jgi:predicted DNA-binding antitoxin AbrB/MazE fold protein
MCVEIPVCDAGARRYLPAMTATTEAIYEAGHLRLLSDVALPEHARVRVVIDTLPADEERREWLAQGERSLRAVWDNDADDIYNALLTQ